MLRGACLCVPPCVWCHPLLVLHNRKHPLWATFSWASHPHHQIPLSKTLVTWHRSWSPKHTFKITITMVQWFAACINLPLLWKIWIGDTLWTFTGPYFFILKLNWNIFVWLTVKKTLIYIFIYHFSLCLKLFFFSFSAPMRPIFLFIQNINCSNTSLCPSLNLKHETGHCKQYMEKPLQ